MPIHRSTCVRMNQTRRAIAALEGSTTGPTALLATISVAIVLCLPAGVASGSNTTTAFRPPFNTLQASTVSNAGVSGCGTNATVGVPAFFNSTSGAFGLAINASGSTGANCTHHNGLASSANAQGYALLVGPNFTISKSGSYIFRTNWRLAWHVHVWLYGSPTRSLVNVGTSEIGIIATLYDRTTGVKWGNAGSYDNSTSVSISGVVNDSFNSWISLPFLAPLTQGDTYYFTVLVFADVSVYVAAQHYSSHAKVIVGGSAGKTELRAVTVTLS
jgi:hypothetical protein